MVSRMGTYGGQGNIVRVLGVLLLATYGGTLECPKLGYLENPVHKQYGTVLENCIDGMVDKDNNEEVEAMKIYPIKETRKFYTLGQLAPDSGEPKGK